MFLESNFQYLNEYNEILLGEIAQVSTGDLDAITVQGTTVFKLVDDEGKEFYSSSIYDPEYEAEVFLKDLNMDNTGYIIFGLNSYCVIKKILAQKTLTSWVFVIEKDIRIIKRFLEEVDLSPFLKDKLQRLVFFYGEDAQAYLHQFLHSLVGFYFLQSEVLRTFPTFRKDKEYYDSVLSFIIDTIKNHVFNIGNDLDDTLLGIKNELSNIKHVLKQPRLKDIKGIYKDVPIICVASGPSLDKQLELLKIAKGKCIIIAAESALKALLKNNITPDIVCILERGPNSYDLSIKGLDVPEDTVLVGLTVIDPRIFDCWPNYKIPGFKENLSTSQFIHNALGDFGSFYSGNSVAHMNYMLAYYLGGSPIILIGQDLAYSETGITHSKHTIYNLNNERNIEDNLRNLIKDSLHNTESYHNKPVYLDGYYGGKVKSRELWKQFLIWLEHLVQISGTLTINATEGGADIKGTLKMPFKQVIEQYCTVPVVPLTKILDNLVSKRKHEKYDIQLNNLYEQVQQTLFDLRELQECAKENLDHLQDFLGQLEQNNTLHVEIKATEILRNTETIILNILSNSLFSFYFRPLIANLHVKVNPISRINSIERLKEILVHQRFFLAGTVDGAQKMVETYELGMKKVFEDFGVVVNKQKRLI